MNVVRNIRIHRQEIVTGLRRIVVALLLALAGGSVHAMSDAQLKTIVDSRLHGDRTGALFAVAVIDKSVSRAHVWPMASRSPASMPRPRWGARLASILKANAGEYS